MSMKAKKVQNMELDKLDRGLLNLLQENAKLPYSELARVLAISPSGVHKRLKRLIEIGAISKFVAVINTQLAGKKLKAFIGISTSPGTCKSVVDQLRESPEVLEIHEVAGEHDLFVKLVTDDTLKLNDLLHEMDKIPGVSSTRTIIVLKTEKETEAVHV